MELHSKFNVEFTDLQWRIIRMALTDDIEQGMDIDAVKRNIEIIEEQDCNNGE